MTHRWSSSARSLLSRRVHVPLRLKVMAGVVMVTLVALAAFDVGVFFATRSYLLAQTDNSLITAMAVTKSTLTSPASEGLTHPPRGSGAARAPGPDRYNAEFPGDLYIAFLPFHGRRGIIEADSTTAGFQRALMRPATESLLAEPGPHTVLARKSEALRILSARVTGGSLLVGTSLDQVTSTADQVELIVTVGSIAVVLLIGLGVFVVVRRGLRPIEAMAGQADRITGGDLTDRVTMHNPRTEVGRLGAALNGMLARIEAGQQQMRRFFSDASHELRTPLASLRANAQLYQQGALNDPVDVDEVMGRIVLETRRMGQLVDDMLRLARLDQRPCQSWELVDLTALASGCADHARLADPTRVWQVQIADGLTMTGDQELLRRAVDNLLMNVLAHTPARTIGAIRASGSGDRVTIEVSDDGPGVPPDHLPHIFERFYRAGPGSGSPGSGLGLAIAAEIATAHGGTAQAAHVSPHGLTVALTCPSSQARRLHRELTASSAPEAHAQAR